MLRLRNVELCVQSSQAINTDLSSVIKDFLSTTFKVYFFLHKIFVCDESILLQKRTLHLLSFEFILLFSQNF